MKKISILVWIGLIINLLLLGTTWFLFDLFPTEADMYGVTTYEERELILVLIFMIKPFSAAIALQIISLFLLKKIPKLGLTLAVIGSIVMLPLSLFFMMGYFYSYENCINKNLVLFNKQTVDLSLIFKSSQLNLMGILYIFVGIIAAFMGLSIGVLVTIAGIFSLYNAYRLKNRILVGLSQDHLIITPNIFAKTYLVPLNDVSIIKNSDSGFKLHIKSAAMDRKITYRKGLINGDNYKDTLETIFSKLPTQQ